MPSRGHGEEQQVEQIDRTMDEIKGYEKLHEAIWDNIHRKCFYLAKEASMCSGPLRGTFGYNSIIPTARDILEGTYKYPPNSNEATKEILQECRLICLCVPKNSVSLTIAPVEWNNHWHPGWEETYVGTWGITRQAFNHNMCLICMLFKQLSLSKEVSSWRGGQMNYRLCWRGYLGACSSPSCNQSY